MSVVEYILYFLTEILMVYLLLESYSKISINKKKVLKRINFPLITGTVLLFINNIFNISEFKILMSFIIILITNLLYFKDDLKETIQNTIIVVIVYVLVEIIFTIIFLSNANNLDYLNSNIYLKLIFSILVFFVTYFIISLYKVNAIFIKIKKITKDVFSIEIIFLLIFVILNILALLIGKDFNNLYSIISIIISLIYIYITTTGIIKRQYNIKKLKAKNKELTNSYKNYTKAFDDFREFKHNLKNDLYSIKTVIPNDKQQLLNNLINKYNEKYDWLNNLNNIPEGLEGILYLKRNEAENFNVKLIINYQSKSKILDKDFLDMCDVLGILLDNAIESSKLTRKKIVLLDVIENKKFIIIKIVNKFKNKINIDELYKKDYSTKEKKSGLGLHYIDKLNNKNIKVNISLINNLFVANIFYRKTK